MQSQDSDNDAGVRPSGTDADTASCPQDAPTERSDELLTTDEVAAVLRVTGRTVRRLAETGTLPQIKLSERIIRYRRDDVLALMRAA